MDTEHTDTAGPGIRPAVLTLDGGGIRGLITALWLHRLQASLDRPLPRAFDVIAGTSTGSLLACGMASGHSAEDLIGFYQQHGAAVFPRRAGRFAGRLRKLFSGSRYDHSGLRAVLDDVVGDRRLGEAGCRVMVTCYAPERNEPVLFDSADPACASLSMRDICLASASLPGIFPPHTVNLPGFGPTPLVDGGIWSTDPAPQTVAALLSPDLPPQGLLLASFGTGIAANPPPRIAAMQPPDNVTGLDWMLPGLQQLHPHPLQPATQEALRGSIYERFQTVLADALAVPDHAGRNQLKGMLGAAQRLLDEEGGNQRIEQLADLLGASLPQPAAT